MSAARHLRVVEQAVDEPVDDLPTRPPQKESKTPPENPTNSGTVTGGEAPQSPPRPRNIVWDACVEVLGYEPRTKTEKSLWGKVVASLQSGHATPSEIREVATWYRRHWPGVDLTITALEKWFTHFLTMAQKKRKGSPPCPECEVGAGRHAEGCSRA